MGKQKKSKPEDAGADTPETSQAGGESTDVPVPSVFDKARGLLVAKGGLVAKNSKISQELADAQGRVTSLTEENVQLKAQVKAYQEEEQKLQQALDDVEKEKKTVSQEATDQLASLGVPEAKLPAQKSADVETLDSIREQINKETDPIKKAQLAQKSSKLRGM